VLTIPDPGTVEAGPHRRPHDRRQRRRVDPVAPPVDGRGDWRRGVLDGGVHDVHLAGEHPRRPRLRGSERLVVLEDAAGGWEVAVRVPPSLWEMASKRRPGSVIDAPLSASVVGPGEATPEDP
jgi:hypothetical protein